MKCNCGWKWAFFTTIALGVIAAILARKAAGEALVAVKREVRIKRGSVIDKLGQRLVAKLQKRFK
jgi:hypothetical protein